MPPPKVAGEKSGASADAAREAAELCEETRGRLDTLEACAKKELATLTRIRELRPSAGDGVLAGTLSS